MVIVLQMEAMHLGGGAPASDTDCCPLHSQILVLQKPQLETQQQQHPLISVPEISTFLFNKILFKSHQKKHIQQPQTTFLTTTTAADTENLQPD